MTRRRTVEEERTFTDHFHIKYLGWSVCVSVCCKPEEWRIMPQQKRKAVHHIPLSPHQVRNPFKLSDFSHFLS